MEPTLYLLIYEHKQLVHGVCNGDRAGLFHSGNLAIAPGNTDGGNAVSSSAQHIKFRITHHQNMPRVTDLTEKIGDHIRLVNPRAV